MEKNQNEVQNQGMPVSMDQISRWYGRQGIKVCVLEEQVELLTARVKALEEQNAAATNEIERLKGQGASARRN